MESYLSLKTIIKKSEIDKHGLFALKLIKKGEIIGIKNGHIIDRSTLNKLGGLKSEIGKAVLQIENNFFIGPMKKSEINKFLMHINHSCNPNVGLLNGVISVAMKDIKAGKELVNDYAMWLNDNDFRFICLCGSKNCRKNITGRDWKIKKLQHKYKRYFSEYIKKQISI